MGKEALELKEKDFEKSVKEGKWVVDFFAPWCGPCQMMAPEFEAAAKKMKGKIKFGKVDIDEESSVALKYHIMSVPTMILFKDGKIVGKHSGWISSDGIVELANESF